jgi:hypothetical protein
MEEEGCAMKWHYVVREEYRELGLTGFSLIIYSIIAGYSQNGRGCYYAGLATLADMAGCHPDSAQRIVRKLSAAGLIVKEKIVRENGICLAISLPAEPAEKGEGVPTSCPEGSRHFVRRGPDILPDENGATPILEEDKSSSLYKNNKKEISTRARARVRESFTKPTLEEVREYCDTRANDVDPEQFFDHYESNGWMVGKAPMKDWRAAVRNWERRDLRDRPARKENRPARKESSFERSLREFDRMYGTNFMEDEGHGKD